MRLSLAVSMFCGLVAAGLGLNWLPACTSTSEKKEAEEVNNASKLSDDEEAKLNEYKAEVELGRSMAGRLLQFYGTYGDEQLITYVNQVGNYVAGFGDHPDRRYMFAILDTESVNAFACPGGYILLTLGSIRMARTEAELAMILGHEVAHVGKQHMFKTLKSMGEKEREDAAKSVDKKGGEKVSYEVAVRRRPSAESSQTGALMARYLSGSSGTSLGLLQAAKAGMSVILEKGLDKELEFEADQEGVKYAIRAGYAPKSLMSFLGRLAQQKKKNTKKVNTDILEKTHPKVNERVDKIKKLLDEMKAEEIVGAYGKKRFRDYLQQLPAPKKA